MAEGVRGWRGGMIGTQRLSWGMLGPGRGGAERTCQNGISLEPLGGSLRHVF